GYITPAADRLAREGMRFSAGYATAPVCSPSRYSIQYGQSPARHGITYVSCKAKFDHVAPDTLAELVKKADPRYATAHFGKWHIDAMPSALGFDESDGRTKNSEGGFGSRNEHGVVKVERDPKLTVSLMHRANDFMARQVSASRPFFLQVSHYANHTWITADPADLRKYEAVPESERLRHPVYSAMTEALDRSIGGVLAKLDELGIADRTYVIFTADNGAIPSFPPVPNPKRNLNGPLSDGKWSVLEGGVRVPLIVRGPGIPPGTQCDAPVSGVDFLPTVAELAGLGELETSQPLDGRSFVSLLHAGNAAADFAAFDKRALVWHYPKMGKWEMTRPGSAIRRDGWKLVHSWKDGSTRLYHVRKDIGESEDLSAVEPERAAALKKELFGYLRNVGCKIPQQREKQKK
ncbi:MAG: sulfatase, partial [Verrucomicrobiota bacterium]